MKYGKKILILLPLIGIIHSCKKDDLNQPALGSLDETALQNKKGVEGLLIAAYSLLDGTSVTLFNYGAAGSNWIYGSVCGSEAYKGGPDLADPPDISALETFIPNAYNKDLAEKWTAVFDGIARANDALRVMKKAKDISAEDQKRIAAEARFLRAWYHFEAKKIWNNIPFVDESITIEANNFHVANDKNIWPDIENDLKYAMDNLQATPYGGAAGRANKFTAMAVLAKAYMFQKKFDLAKPLLEAIINSGKYKLYDNYHDNFDPAKKNGLESIFAAQISVNDAASPLNANFGDFLNYPTNVGYGFFQPSQYFVNHFKTNAAGLPDLITFNDTDVKNDQGISSNDPFTPYTGPLDPRLDWAVGRRGIPYLDWSNHPGKKWIREQDFGGPYNAKKNVIAQSQNGAYADQSWGTPTMNANNINLIRYADVLLWAAEVEVENGNLNQAQVYVNMIRNRMADHHEGWVHKYLNDNNPMGGFYSDDAHLAANYIINPYSPGYFSSQGQDYARKAVRYERMLELGMEGQRFFDLVRWGIADTEIKSYLEKEKNSRSYLNDAEFKKNIHEYFPIPQTQIDLSAGADGILKMKQNPGYD